MTHLILTLITSVYVISSFFVPTGPPLVLGNGLQRGLPKIISCLLLFTSVCQGGTVGTHAVMVSIFCLSWMCMHVCLQSIQGQANVCNVPCTLSVLVRVRPVQTALAHGHAHTFSFFFSCFFSFNHSNNQSRPARKCETP